MTDFDVREYRPEDQPALLELHNRAFGSEWSEARWRWRFLDNPLGRPDVLAAFRADGECVALYGGVTLPCVIDGEPGLAMNHADVCISPELQRALGGSRRLIDLTRRFFDRSGKLVDLVWGFPEPGLLRTANRFAGVQVIRDVLLLVRDRPDPIEAPQGVDVRVLPRFDKTTDALWQTCEDELRTAIRRDATYLNWRFVDHPNVEYRLIGAFSAGTEELRGIAVVRDGGWQPSILSLSEWIVPREDREAETALIARVSEFAAAQQRPLVAWFPAPMLEFRRFQIDHGFFAISVPYQQCGRWWSTGVTRHWLHENWYQTMGDIDFF